MGNVLLIGANTSIPPLLILTLTPLTATSSGQAYSQPLAVSGGVPPYRFALSNFQANGSPASSWITCNPVNGTLTGVAPNDTENDTFTITCTDFLGHPTSKNFSLQVNASGALIITTNTLGAALVGVPYAGPALAASGGTAPYFFNQISAAPNDDLWVRCDGTKFYGIAQMAENESVSFRVRDSAGATRTTTLVLPVTASGPLAMAAPAGITLAAYYGAATSVAAGVAGAIAVNWNPGHYMLSNATGLTNGNQAAELAALAASPGVVGYMPYAYWGDFQQSQGVYNFAALDNLLAQCAAMTPARHVFLQLQLGPFAGPEVPSGSVAIPAYILQNAIYGAGLVGNSGLTANPSFPYGWYVADLSFAPNFATNAHVLGEFIAFINAFAAHYNGNPNLEGVILEAWDATSPTPGTGITDTQFFTARQSILTQMKAVFTTINVANQGGFTIPGGNSTDVQTFADFCIKNAIMPGSSDTIGIDGFNAGYTDIIRACTGNGQWSAAPSGSGGTLSGGQTWNKGSGKYQFTFIGTGGTANFTTTATVTFGSSAVTWAPALPAGTYALAGTLTNWAPLALDLNMVTWFGDVASNSTYVPPTPALMTYGHAMMSVQQGDFAAGVVQVYPVLETPINIISALNQKYNASHAFWNYLNSSQTTTVAAQWPNLAPVLAANPLTNTSYPSSYPVAGAGSGAELFTLKCLVQGGQPPYTWKFAGTQFAVTGASGTQYALPFNGWLQGATAGTTADSLNVVCLDNNGAQVTQTISLTNHSAASAMSFYPLDTTNGGIATLMMPPAYVGQPFKYQLLIGGGSGSGLTFSISSGALPAGLTLNGSTGLISGTPTQTGASNSCIVKCVDSNLTPATAHLYFNIDAANVGTRPAYSAGTGLYVDAGGVLRDSANFLFQPRGMNRAHFDSASWAGPANGALARPAAARTNFFNLGLTPAQIASNFLAQHINNNEVPIIMYGYFPGAVGTSGNSDVTKFAQCLTDWINAFSTFQSYQNFIIINVANEWGLGNSTAWLNAYAGIFANVSAISGTTITVNTVSATNPFANCPVAFLHGAGGIADQVINLTSPGGVSGAWTVVSSVSFLGYTGGGTLNGGAIGALRTAGYTCPILIDTGDFGEDPFNILRYSSTVNNSDPQKSCIFALHPYQSALPWTAVIQSVTQGNPTVLTLASNAAYFPLNPTSSGVGANNFNDHYQISGAQGLTLLNGLQPSDAITYGSAGNWQVHLTVDSTAWSGTYVAGSAVLIPAAQSGRNLHYNYVVPLLAALRAQGVCAILGEFGPGNQSGNVLTPENNLNVQQSTPGQLICACEANQVPWLAWAWDDHNNNTTAFSGNWFNFVFGNNGVYSTPANFTAVGLDVVGNPRYGLWALAQPMASYLSPANLVTVDSGTVTIDTSAVTVDQP